jgi:hypothetical protein
MTLGSTQLLIEMSTMNLPGVKARLAHEADKLTDICEPIAYKIWESRRLTTLWSSTVCNRERFTYELCKVRQGNQFRNFQVSLMDSV